MSTVVIELTSDEARLLRGLAKATEGEKQMARGMEEVTAASNKATMAAEQLAKASGKPVSEIDKLLRELRKTGPEGGKQARAIEKALGDAGAHGRRSVGTILGEIAKIDDAAKDATAKAKAHLKEMGDESKKSIGGQAVSDVARLATGWMSVSAAVGLTREAIARVRTEQQKALSSLEQQADPNKRLLQVATSAEDFNQLAATADRLAMEYGISRQDAKALMFSARSEGFEGAAGFIASNAQVLDVASQATVAGQIPGLFKNETVTPEQAINMGLVAASESRLDFEQIARAMPGAAEGGALAGASASETFGALSVLAGRFKSGDTAADRLKAFASAVGLDQGNEAMGRGSLQGQGIMQAVKSLQGMSEEQRRDFLGGSQEVNAAYAMLVEEFQVIQERIAKIDQAQSQAGTAESALAQKRGIATADPQLAALRETQRAANQREIANERANAEKEAQRQTQRDAVAAGAYNRGENAIEIVAGEMVGDALRGVGADSAARDANRAISSGDLGRLQRSAAWGMDAVSGQQDQRLLGAVTFGAGRLLEADASAEPGTLGTLSKSDVAGFIREATGTDVDWRTVTPEMQSMLTGQLRAASAANPQRATYDITGIGAMFGYGAAADARAIIPVIQLDELLAEMKRSNELQAEANQAAKETANNTSNNKGPAPPRNYSAGQNAAAERAGRPSF